MYRRVCHINAKKETNRIVSGPLKGGATTNYENRMAISAFFIELPNGALKVQYESQAYLLKMKIILSQSVPKDELDPKAGELLPLQLGKKIFPVKSFFEITSGWKS